MKKLLYGVAMLATVLFAGSCQRENLEPAQTTNAVTFTVEAPGTLQTRSIADGMNVNELVYEVWLTEEVGQEDLSGETKKAERLYQAKTTLQNDGGVNRTSITLDLVNDQNFTILFWAQVNTTAYPAAYKTDNLTAVTYAKDTYNSNDENLAAFYSVAFVKDCSHVDTDGKSISSKVYLRRPFAQLNLGTTNSKKLADSANAPTDDYTISLVSSAVEVTTANTVFNVSTSEVSEDAVVTFANAPVPTDPNVLTIKEGDKDVNYDYVAMNYLFAGDNASVEYDIVTKLNGNTEVTVNNTVDNVPLRENYRTNIIGNLLTSKVDYEIVVDASWANEEDEPINISVWDGSSLKEPARDGNIYTIYEPSELAWLAAAVNGTLPVKSTTAPDTFKGKTFVLSKDIYLGGHYWTPIGNSTNNFQGTFDGQGHTISSLVIDAEGQSNVGLFGMTTEGEIKNLTVDGAKVSGRLAVGVVAGCPYTSKYTNIKVTGHVEVNGMAYVGGVGGRNAYAKWENITVDVDETSYVRANSVENGTAYRTYVGGVVGFNGEGGHSFTNISSNIDVYGSTIDVGGLFGIAHYGNNFVNCSCSGNVEITDAADAADAEEIGGIAGVWNNGGDDVTFDGCSFTGKLTTNITEGVDLSDNAIVGKAYSETGPGKLIIKNANAVVYVKDNTELNSAAKNAIDGTTTIKFLNDITGPAVIDQVEGKNIVVDGCDYKYDGTIDVYGHARNEGVETLIIENVNFEHKSGGDHDFISCNTTDPDKRYAHNVTVRNCTFTGYAGADVVGMRYRQCYNLSVQNSSATDMHSMMWATGSNGISVSDVTLSNCKNGFSFGTSTNINVINSKIDATEPYGHAIRVDASGNYNMSVTGCELKASVPVLMRNTTGDYTLNLSDNVLTTTGEYQLIVCANDYKVGVELEEPTCEYTVNGSEGLKAFPVRVIHEPSGLIWNGKNDRRFWIYDADQLVKASKYFQQPGITGEGKEVTLELENDIDLTGKVWDPWTVMWITFNGNGHIISNLTTPEVWRGGFFGYLGAAKVNDLTLENVTVSGAQAGILAGSVEGVTTNNVKIAGKNCVSYVEANQPSGNKETWGGVGAVTGILNESTINAEIVAGAEVIIESNSIETEAVYIDIYTGYLAKNTGKVIDNGSTVKNSSTTYENVGYAITETSEGTYVTLTSTSDNTIVYRGLVSDDKYSDLVSITVGEGVVRLNNRCFCKNPTLETVTLPNSLTYIDESVFQQSGIKAITIPENVTYIGKQALGACNNLESVTINAKNVTIANYVARACANLKEVIFNSDSITFESGSMYFTNKENADASGITFYVKNQNLAEVLYNAFSTSHSYGLKIVSIDGQTTYYNTLK